MRNSIPCSLLLLVLAGCIWQPDPTQNPIFYSDVSFDAHVVSYRSLDGTEHTITAINPAFDGDIYGDFEYNGLLADSVRYIVVNGDTAYRHPSSQSPKVYDSSSTYHIDGSRNIVTLVFPGYSLNDTNYDSLVAQITSPPPGSTLGRTTDGLFTFQTDLVDISGLSGSMQLTDSNGISFTNQLLGFVDTGTVDFTYNQMTEFNPGNLWAVLHLDYYDEDSPFYTERHTALDRIIAYTFE
jgi:hypothetical protein